MTARTDIAIDYIDSPRILEVDAPSTEMTMQDLVDTVRKQEDSFQGMSYPKLVNASGKEDLGGGVFVGITVAEQNMRLAFEGRTTPAETGTVTSNPGSPVVGRDSFIDTNALFITNGVARGSLVINFTDQSIAEVYRVDSEIQLTTKTLVNGIGNTFDAADVYHVFNVIQCTATGGNLVAVNEAQSSIPAVLPTAFTQIVLTASSSATQNESQDIQYASFNGGVWVDLLGTASGTTFPTGTERLPVNNFVDALLIAQERGFLTIYIIGDAVVDSGSDLTDYRLIGQGVNLSSLTLDPSATFVNSSFQNATITGTLDGNSSIKDCIVSSLTFVSGVIEECILDAGTIILGGGAAASFINCASGVPGLGSPVIDLGGSGQALALRNYNGGITLTNKTGSDSVSVDLNSGQITLDNTVTAGTIVLRGVGKVTDNSAGATVIDEVLDAIKLQAVYDRLDMNAAKPNVYANDGSTITGTDFTLTRTDNGTDTTVQRS